VLLYDHRGHGHSGRPDGTWTMHDLVDDAAQIVESWGHGPVAFIGLSMGGMVGQGLAVRWPELVQGLVLANTVAAYGAEAQAGWQQRITKVKQSGMAAVAELVVERYLHAAFRSAHPEVADAVRRTVLDCDPLAYAINCSAVAQVNWLPELDRIACPTQVIAGALDMGATPEAARAIATAIPGAVLDVLADASHLSVAEAPADFERLVAALLSAAGSRTAFSAVR
jgi:3-oxoadipate enol-lactonase